MPNFGLDELNSNVFPKLQDGTDTDRCAVRKESGDAQLRPSNHSDYLKSVTEQKIDFSKLMRSRRSKAKSVIRTIKSSRRDNDDHIEKVITNLPAGDQEGWLDAFLKQPPSKSENFYTTLHTKAPNLNETCSLLDQVMELRSDLEDRVTELRCLGEEMRNIRQVMKLDPFSSLPKLENKTSMAKVLSSVRTMQNLLCSEMEKQTSQNVF